MNTYLLLKAVCNTDGQFVMISRWSPSKKLSIVSIIVITAFRISLIIFSFRTVHELDWKVKSYRSVYAWPVFYLIWIHTVSVFYPLLSFFYAFLLYEKVMFFLLSIFIRMSLSTLTKQWPIGQNFFQKMFFTKVKQPYFEISLSLFIIGVARFLITVGPNHKSHRWTERKKKPSQSGSEVLIGGGVKFCWRPI